METQDLSRVIDEKEDSGVARLILNWPEKANLVCFPRGRDEQALRNRACDACLIVRTIEEE